MPLLIVFNPLLMPMVARVFSYTSVGRMLRIPFYYLAYAYGAGMVLEIIWRLARLNWARNVFKASLYLAVCGIFLFAAKPGHSVIQHLNFDHQLPPITRVVDHLKPGSLVLSDPVTSTDIVEFADVYSLVIQFNGPVDLVDISTGRQVMGQVLHQDLTLATVREILENEGINYILVDKRPKLPKDVGIAYTNLLHIIYSDQNYVLYKVELDKIHGGSS